MFPRDITIFDFETSGLDPQKEQVIEMAALRVVDGEIVTEFDTLVELDGRELPPKITELTGIRPDMLVHAMGETFGIKMLRIIMGGSLLVAHNAAFDLSFLHFAMMRIAGKTFSNPFLDTMTISRERHPYPHRLDVMCERYGIQLDGAHRALNDVQGTWKLLQALDAEESVEPYINRLGYLNKYGPPSWAPAYADLFGTDNRYERRYGT